MPDNTDTTHSFNWTCNKDGVCCPGGCDHKVHLHAFECTAMRVVEESMVLLKRTLPHGQNHEMAISINAPIDSDTPQARVPKINSMREISLQKILTIFSIQQLFECSS